MQCSKRLTSFNRISGYCKLTRPWAHNNVSVSLSSRFEASAACRLGWLAHKVRPAFSVHSQSLIPGKVVRISPSFEQCLKMVKQGRRTFTKSRLCNSLTFGCFEKIYLKSKLSKHSKSMSAITAHVQRAP